MIYSLWNERRKAIYVRNGWITLVFFHSAFAGWTFGREDWIMGFLNLVAMGAWTAMATLQNETAKRIEVGMRQLQAEQAARDAAAAGRPACGPIMEGTGAVVCTGADCETCRGGKHGI